MIKPTALSLFFALLAGCIMHTRGDADSVTVPNVTSASEGLYNADPHCAQFGKAASFKRMTGASTAMYECVPGGVARPQ